MINEIELLRQLDHPNIVKIFEFFQDDKRFYIVTELLKGGELFDKIIKYKKFTEYDAAKYMKQVLSALAYCHSHHIVHRDLKLENLLLESNSEDSPLKIIDFGASICYEYDKKMKGKKGTPYYIAPEVLLKKYYDEKCDVWSSGILLYIFLVGVPPFYGNSDVEILEQVKKGTIDYFHPSLRSISKEARNLLMSLTKYNPAKRCTSLEALQHPWFNILSKGPSPSKELTASVLDNMHKFKAYSKLEQAAYMYIATQLFTNKERETLREVFISMDTNHDGQLSKEELVNGYSKIIGNKQSSTRIVEEIMMTADPNNNGMIDFTEFIVASSNKKMLPSEEKLKSAFGMFDIV